MKYIDMRNAEDVYELLQEERESVEKLTDGIKEVISQLDDDLYYADETDTEALLNKLKALIKE